VKGVAPNRERCGVCHGTLMGLGIKKKLKLSTITVSFISWIIEERAGDGEDLMEF